LKTGLSAALETESPETIDSVARNLAKEALYECEQRFRILLDALNDGIIIHDKFKIVDANPAFAAIFGYARHEVIGRDVLEFAEAQSRDLLLAKLFNSDQVPFEVTGLKKNGATFAIELCSGTVPHRGNRLYLTLCRKPSESVPKNQEKDVIKESLGTFFDLAPDAYYLADANGKFIDINKAAEEMFGYKKEDIIGKGFLKLNILGSDQITKAARNLALNIFGKYIESEEYVIHTKEGSRIPVEIRTRPVKVNKKTLIFGMVRDITEKRKADEALRRAFGEIEVLLEACRSREIRADSASKKKK
jgi:PAS domain S-box-containing protein